jgi:DNA-binding NarL/FixJ family response regulator
VTKATLIIADDHPLFRAALKQAVFRYVPAVEIIEASSLDTLQRAIVDHPDADLVLLDLMMPGAKGFSSLVFLRAQYPTVPVVVVSAAEDATVIKRALDFGASGFIPKSARIETIGEMLRIVLGGGIAAPRLPGRVNGVEERDGELARRLASLTPQQLKVLVMLAEGESNKYIAGSLAITEATVKAHITAILRKLGVERRTQAAIIAQRLLQTGEGANVDALDDGVDQSRGSDA